MAIKYECDRCHKQFDEQAKTAVIELPPVHKSSQGLFIDRGNEKTKELCATCIIELLVVFDAPPKEV